MFSAQHHPKAHGLYHFAVQSHVWFQVVTKHWPTWWPQGPLAPCHRSSRGRRRRQQRWTRSGCLRRSPTPRSRTAAPPPPQPPPPPPLQRWRLEGHARNVCQARMTPMLDLCSLRCVLLACRQLHLSSNAVSWNMHTSWILARGLADLQQWGRAGAAAGGADKTKARVLREGSLTLIAYGADETLRWLRRIGKFQCAVRCAPIPLPPPSPRLELQCPLIRTGRPMKENI